MKQPISILPAIALRGTTILPDMIVHFDVSRERSIKAIEAAMLHDQKIFLVTQKDPEVEKPELSELYQVGTVAYIKQVVKLPHDLLRVLVEGIERAELLGLEQEEPFLKAETALFEPDGAQYTKSLKEAMFRSMQELFQRYCMESGKISKDLAAQIMNITELEELISQISVNVPLTYQNKQKILEAVSLENQYEVLAAILNNEIEVLQIGHDLQRKLKARVDKNQRDYILREQLKLIREELGEENTADTAEEYRQKAEALDAPQEVKDKLNKEIDRFKSMNNAAAESSVLSTYIETLLGLPWNKKSEDSTDLKEAWKILEEGHYGLKDVKERIMEFLAVRKLTSGGKSPILCLVGPPGTGKTSIAKSVAEALHKKYVRICLGGVRDEAEIRGHRKTYVGAMPGRITAALSQAGVNNPLMLLDEIDKTSSDYKGDTSAALLEVLDPEQNNHFNDHYVEVPQDLSEVLFIATANDMDGIPRPLLDRMEVIEISGYTENEKEHIAKDHLIPKQLEVNGIPEGKLKIQTPALRKIITLYTREAGVRGLEHKIGQICRKAAREIMENDQKKVTVNSKNLENYLGKARYSYLMANKKDEVGIARGLAWTQVGGDTLQIEVNVMPGKGELVLTGQLGDVMKESAQAGISYIRSVADKYG
ncbi:MAG: endopeptidase La, partial [Coprococcus sp.]|nr:endopeptidase La [Coprococcus sp.]